MPTISTTATAQQRAALRRLGRVSHVLAQLVAEKTGLPGPVPKKRGRPRKRK
jgi:hypothetical protein